MTTEIVTPGIKRPSWLRVRWNRFRRFLRPGRFDGTRRDQLVEMIRMFLIERWDRRPDTCWADMVMWALPQFDAPWFKDRDILPGDAWYDGVASCRADARRCGSCYCGKFIRHDTPPGRSGAQFVVTSEWTAEDRGDNVARISFSGDGE